ncbi:MAG: hypothetical protein NTZ74_14050 [Chloroflexi bacterium]|nr:hypothetical protein [Chloroflexota bacterium]
MSKKHEDVTRPIETGPKPIKTDQVSEKTMPVRIKRTSMEEAKSDHVPVPDTIIEIVESGKKKVRRGKWIWLGILLVFVITAIGAAIGYSLALNARISEETNQKLIIATTQFEIAIQDQKAGRLDMSMQRLKYILEVYPNYPGIDEKIKEVMVAIALINPATISQEATTQSTFVAVPTKDTKETSALLNQAQAQLAGSDWQGLLTTVNQLRDIDPEYEPIKVDGLLFYALRYNGVSEIKNGHLEVGLYYFAMAEQLAPIDKEAESFRTWAKMYLNAGSWYGLNWPNAIDGFYQIYTMVPNLMDSSGITAKMRYEQSLEGYGDFLETTNAWCDAVVQFEAANNVLSTQPLIDKLNLARGNCANPPALPTPTPEPPDLSTPTIVPTPF